jgi:hypothetical protein
MDSWQVAVLMLVAVLVGALLPLLVQLYSVLHTLKQVVGKTATDIEQMTKTIHRTADRLDRITAGLERDGRLEHVMDSVSALSSMVLQLRDTVKVASAVGAAVVPAVGAAVRAWQGSHHGGDPPEKAPAGERGGSAPGEDLEKEVAS